MFNPTGRGRQVNRGVVRNMRVTRRGIFFAAAVVAWLLLIQPRFRQQTRTFPSVLRETPALRDDRVLPGVAWQVLAPRHRGTSPVPLTILFTPGWLGPVEVLIETPRGRHATVTPARGIPWPQALPPLRVGDWCAVTIRGPHGRRAEAAYLRVPLPRLEAGMGEPDFLELGLPALAILRGGAELPVASLRAGVTEVPERGPSATMARAREW
jgi:hypothetical protein